MRRSLLLVSVCLCAVLCACAGPQAIRSNGSTTKTETLVKTWGEVWISHYNLSKSLPTALDTGVITDANDRLIGDFDGSLNGRGGCLATTDSWGTLLHCYTLLPTDAKSGPAIIIASPGPNRTFDSTLQKAAAAGDCYEDDIIYRVVFTSDGLPPTASLLKAVPTPKPITTTPAGTLK
jgi:hypothetical protein